MHDLTDREIRALDRLEVHAASPHPYLARLAATKIREILERGATFTRHYPEGHPGWAALAGDVFDPDLSPIHAAGTTTAEALAGLERSGLVIREEADRA